jgi:hypothetical protein
MAYVQKVKYERTVLLKPQDNLVSSDYPEVPAFMVLQKKCEKPDMFYLMSMEYQDIWTKKKNAYLNSFKKKTNGRNFIKENATMIKPRHVRPKVEEKPLKKTTKYDHIQSKYHVTNRPPRKQCEINRLP